MDRSGRRYSLAIETLGTLVMVWSRWWHPGALATGIAPPSAIVLVIDVSRVPPGVPPADSLVDPPADQRRTPC